MRRWRARRLAEATGASLLAEPRERRAGGDAPVGPLAASVDTRTLARGELFVGLRGERTDGGAHAARALAAGAWGVLVAPAHARAATQAARASGGAALVHEDPLAALHALARAWRGELGERGAKVVAITGSTGKTSTKDILATLLAARLRTAATPANLNTEVGLPLALLAAAPDAQAVVLEMAMRGAGQIAQLTEIAQPEVGVIVNVGPAHLELLGSLAAIAAAKAELIAGMRAGATAVVPAGEPLLAGHLREDVRTITFGEGGEVTLAERCEDGRVLIEHEGERIELRPSFAQAHQLRNLLAAVAAMRALGLTPRGRVDVRFSAMRGQREQLAGGVALLDDCYNANPMSMRAAIDELAATAGGRRVAVLGDMLELGREAPRMHREIGEHASARGVDVLVGVGELAAQSAAAFAAARQRTAQSAAGEIHTTADAREAAGVLAALVRDGDTVLVKGSRGVGLELVAQRLREERAPLGADAAAVAGARAGAPALSAGAERR